MKWIRNRRFFHGGNIIKHNLITCKYMIGIPSILQSYIFNWYYMYLLNPGMDRTEVMTRQHFYWNDIRKSVREEVTNCDTYQCTKWSNIKYGKLPPKEAE